MVVFQPCDWQERDINFKYAVEVFGRTKDDDVIKVRLTGFSPYFYIKFNESYSTGGLVKELEKQVTDANKKYKNPKPVNLDSLKITVENKLDAMSGFSGLAPIKVWKVTCPTLKLFKSVGKKPFASWFPNVTDSLQTSTAFGISLEIPFSPL
jgi:hypothetical protein